MEVHHLYENYNPHENIHGFGLSPAEQDNEEFRKFCLAQEKLRNNPGNRTVVIAHCLAGEEYSEELLLQVGAVFVVLLLGVLVRSILNRTGWGIPYTVVLLVLGVILGQLGFWLCPHLEEYLLASHTKPEILLHTFLPLLIFESAFNISIHTFTKSVSQILIIALPGMLISTFLTALICIPLFAQYQWDFVDSSLFGSIVSATDPVAVVAILRDLGASETLTVLIEGESLFNDGLAVLLFEIFKEILADAEAHRPGPFTISPESLTLNIFLKFLQIAIGGPVFGYLMSKVTIFWLSKVYNDVTVEISITFSMAYLTYFIGEEFLHVSGILGVVVLGLMIRAHETCISPQVEKPLKHFWEMMGYLANTLLFFICGLIMGRKAFQQIQGIDALYLLGLYGALTAIRFLMLVILSPILRQLGYGFEWRNMIVMSWGGLRGAVGLCLALEIYEDIQFCHRAKLGPKILFHTAGIVILTLLINATTTKKLMKLLKMTEISEGRKGEMENALKILGNLRSRFMESFKSNNSFWGTADWPTVDEMTKLSNPFQEVHDNSDGNASEGIKVYRRTDVIFQLLRTPSLLRSSCHCSTVKSFHRMPISTEEDMELAEEARIRVLKALKISFWHQFEQGLISGQVVRILSGLVDNIEDIPGRMLGCSDLSKYWGSTTCSILKLLNGTTHKVRKSTAVVSVADIGNGPIMTMASEQMPIKSRPTASGYLLSKSWFQGLLHVLVLLSVAFSGFEVAHEILYFDECARLQKPFIAIGIFFLVTFLLEMFLKLCAVGCESFAGTCWNYVELAGIALSIGDVVISVLPCPQDNDHDDNYHGHRLVFRCLGLLRILRLVKGLHIGRRILGLIKSKQLQHIHLGYEMGKAYCVGVDHIVKLLPLMSHPHSRSLHLENIRRSLEKEMRDVIIQLGMFQKEFPNVTGAVKVRHASRIVLNHMMRVVQELSQDGLLEDSERVAITSVLEKDIKQLSKCPETVPPPLPHTIIDNLDWFRQINTLGMKSPLLQYFKENGKLMTFVPGEIIYSIGDPPKGVYLIVNGLVRIQFLPTEKISCERRRFGVIPNSEVLGHLNFTERTTDLLGPGAVIGELGFLKHQERAASVVSETFLTCFFFSSEILESAAQRSGITLVTHAGGDDFTLRLWTSWGFKVATLLLQRLPRFDHCTKEEIQGYLERSVVPWISQLTVIEIPEFVSDIVIIEGYFQNYDTQELYVAPCLVPTHCTRLFSKRNPITMNRLLMISHEDIPPEMQQIFLKKSASSVITRTLGHVDEFVRSPTYPLKSERMDIRQRRRSLLISSARTKPKGEKIGMNFGNLP